MADKSPRDVAVEVMKSVKAEIQAYEEGLVKMRAAEVGALKKSLFGLPQQAASNKQIQAKVHKPVRTVFDILGKSEELVKADKRDDIPLQNSPTEKKWRIDNTKATAAGKKGIPVHPTCSHCGNLQSSWDALSRHTKEKHPGQKISSESKKSEEFINTKEDDVYGKRYTHVGANDNKAEPKKEVPAPGSGGELAKDALDAGTKAVKPLKPQTLKPAGIPAMTPNAAPKPPKAPGAPGMQKDEMDADKKPGVFAKLHAIRAQQSAGHVGTPATQNLAAAKVLTSRVLAKKPGSPILKDELIDGDMAMAEKTSNKKATHPASDQTPASDYYKKLNTKEHVEGANSQGPLYDTKKSERTVFEILAKNTKSVKNKTEMTCPYCQHDLTIGCRC